ncbi:hypothetical protein [Nocardia sp. Marseille-Q1738]
MTETAEMAMRQRTVSASAAPQKPAERSSPGWYKLYNDTSGHVSVYRQEWDVPKCVFEVAPGATSDQYEAGHEIYILFSESGAGTMVSWDGWDSVTIHYHVSGYTSGNQVNNVSAFK